MTGPHATAPMQVFLRDAQGNDIEIGTIEIPLKFEQRENHVTISADLDRIAQAFNQANTIEAKAEQIADEMQARNEAPGAKTEFRLGVVCGMEYAHNILTGARQPFTDKEEITP